jgi:hypothetical protein
VNRLPIIKPRQLIRALEKLGFELVRKSPLMPIPFNAVVPGFQLQRAP